MPECINLGIFKESKDLQAFCFILYFSELFVVFPLNPPNMIILKVKNKYLRVVVF